MNFIFLVAFVIASFSLGVRLVGLFVLSPRGLVWAISSAVLGFFVSVWGVYILSVISGSMTVGLVIVDVLGLLLSRPRFRFKVTTEELWVLAVCLAISVWIMFKSFHAGENGMLLVGSNEVFDYGHALSVIRSFSQGANIPYTSPFIAGTPHVYHFLFYFWAGLLERFGVPIVYAFNLPAIVALTALLLMVYSLARYFFRSIWAGILAVYLVLTHSTLTFWYFLRDPIHAANPIGAIWRNASYYFAGPYDQTPISIFWTLNVIVNQRHLVFGLSVILVLYFVLLHILDQKDRLFPRIMLLGLLSGLALWWHTMLFLVAVFLPATVLALRKKYKEALLFVILSGVIGGLQTIPWFGRIQGTRSSLDQTAVLSWFLSNDVWSLLRYWWQNMGLAVLTIPAGFFLLPKSKRLLVIPFFGLFLLANTVRVGRDMTENHKFINVALLMGSILSAGCISWLMEKRGKVGIALTLVSIVLLSFSGVIDLMVIKNDFQYPVADFGASPMMRWIRDNTTPQAVFLSYQDILDPVALSGRKTFFGFFNGTLSPQRAGITKTIYEATFSAQLSMLSTNAIDYLVVPKWKKDDFPYLVDQSVFRNNLHVVYEDARHVVFAVK